ncbi:MAG: sulfur carrier protein ThiS adenylyltransferase ThiF [Thermodesulfobacteriota bacterium]
MQITVNECTYTITPGTDVAQLRANLRDDTAVTLVNGELSTDTRLLKSGDRVSFLGSDINYTPARFDAVLSERHGTEVQQRLQQACVGIAGAGGLGSNLSIALARAGVGHLIIADQDVVELSNLHRQQYFIDQLDQPKVEALAHTLYRINPQIQLKTHHIRVESSNTAALFGAAQILVEAFDGAEAKADLVQSWLQRYPERPLVAASGMAGFDSVNSITTTHPFANLYVCGDGTNGVEERGSLCASRVAVAANHQAHAVIRLLLGLNPVEDCATAGG